MNDIARITEERDEAQAEVERLWRDLTAADGTIDRLRTELAQQDQDLKAAREDVLRLMTERNTARAEVERLKAMLPPTAHTGVRNGPGEGSWSVFAGKVVEERDAARAEVERLTAELARVNLRVDEEAETERIVAERNAARAEVEQLEAEVERLTVERDQPESRPQGREVGRFGWGGHYLDYEAMAPAGPTDKDIWREAFMTLLPSYPWEKAAAHADSALAEYRKRWPR